MFLTSAGLRLIGVRFSISGTEPTHSRSPKSLEMWHAMSLLYRGTKKWRLSIFNVEVVLAGVRSWLERGACKVQGWELAYTIHTHSSARSQLVGNYNYQLFPGLIKVSRSVEKRTCI